VRRAPHEGELFVSDAAMGVRTTQNRGRLPPLAGDWLRL
jgi:hypothetical protein